MSDITKCGQGCAQQDRCWRFLAPAHEYRQAYADFKPDENGDCAFFWLHPEPETSNED